MKRKIVAVLLAFALSVFFAMDPFARAREAAYANPVIALTASQALGASLATILAAYGINPDIGSDALAAYDALAGSYTSFVDGMAGAGADILKENVAAWGGTIDGIDWDNIGSTASGITSKLVDFGKAGVIDLDLLNVANEGKLGIFPFIMSLFIADLMAKGSPFHSYTLSGSTIKVGPHPFGSLTNKVVGYYYPYEKKGIGGLYLVLSGNFSTVLSKTLSGTSFLSIKLFDSHYYYADGSSAMKDLGISSSSAGITIGPDVENFTFVNTYAYSLDFKVGGSLVATYANGLLTGQDVTDNPDVNLGRDWYSDADASKDVLNPTSGALLGADAVIDGDYVANRGSISIPGLGEWAGLGSWADVLDRLRAGVVDGVNSAVNAGQISVSDAITSSKVGTGELVTDTVGNLTKPGSGSSVEQPKFNWKKFKLPRLYKIFPFCLAADFVALFNSLDADPVAPCGDVPVPNIINGDGDNLSYIRVDLAAWNGMAVVMRVMWQVFFTFCLILLTLRFTKPDGGKSGE